MKQNIATGVDESRIMEKTGISAEYADMFYSKQTVYDIYSTYVNEKGRLETEEDIGNEVIPCWSMARVFDMLPPFVTIEHRQCRMHITTPDSPEGGWSISYISPEGFLDRTVCGTTLFKAATSMLIYLVDNGILNYR